MFIVSLTYTAPLEQVDEYIPEHVAYLDKHYQLGHFQLSGRKEPRTGGVILATLESRQALDFILEQDPFHREGLAQYEVTELVVSKASSGLGFLIGV